MIVRTVVIPSETRAGVASTAIQNETQLQKSHINFSKTNFRLVLEFSSVPENDDEKTGNVNLNHVVAIFSFEHESGSQTSVLARCVRLCTVCELVAHDLELWEGDSTWHVDCFII